MLCVQLIVSDAMVESIRGEEYIAALERFSKALINTEVKIIILENKSDHKRNRLWVNGTIFLEGGENTEVPNEKYLNILQSIGDSVEMHQSRFPKLEIIPTIAVSTIRQRVNNGVTQMTLFDEGPFNPPNFWFEPNMPGDNPAS